MIKYVGYNHAESKLEKLIDMIDREADGSDSLEVINFFFFFSNTPENAFTYLNYCSNIKNFII